jgi:hypothetical protein
MGEKDRAAPATETCPPLAAVVEGDGPAKAPSWMQPDGDGSHFTTP